MTDPKPPILFGVDPDEIWKYIPAAAKEAGLSRPFFRLKAPSLAAVVKLENVRAEVLRLAKASEPTVLDEITAIVGVGKWVLPELPEGATDDERAEYSAKNSKLIDLKVRWIQAVQAAETAKWEEKEDAETRILEESVSGWDGLQSGSGKLIDHGAAKGRMGEVLRGDLRAELIRAALAGATVSEADAEDLQSTPA